MTMLKIFKTIQGLAEGLARSPVVDACTEWLRDPMAHPQIAGMEPSELADLPPAQLRARSRE